MEVWWIAFGAIFLVCVTVVVLYRAKMVGEFADLKAQHRQSLEDLEAEGEKRVLRIERASALEKSRAEHHLIRDLMPLADALDRALEVQGADAQAIRTGIELVNHELQRVFERHGIEKLVPEDGELFDPNLHEAVEQRDVNGQEKRVVECFRSGYRQGIDVLRPAMVAVGSAREEVVSADDEPNEHVLQFESDEPVSAQAD